MIYGRDEDNYPKWLITFCKFTESMGKLMIGIVGLFVWLVATIIFPYAMIPISLVIIFCLIMKRVPQKVETWEENKKK